MLNEHTSTPCDLFRALIPWPRHVDRLGIMPSTAVPVTQPEPLTAEAAVARLLAVGLFCRKTSTPGLHILGGTSEFVDRDIHGYRDGFAILAEPDGRFLGLVSGTRGHDDEEIAVETLGKAVDAIIAVYRTRGAL